jgi:hypothetical protein
MSNKTNQGKIKKIFFDNLELITDLHENQKMPFRKISKILDFGYSTIARYYKLINN